MFEHIQKGIRYDDLLDQAINYSNQKQEKLMSQYDMSAGFWYYELTHASLIFTRDPEYQQVVTTALIDYIGSFATNSQTFYWGWANENLPIASVEDVYLLHEFGVKYGMDIFRLDYPFSSTEQEANDLLAISCLVLQRKGYYRTQNEPRSFMLIKDIQHQ